MDRGNHYEAAFEAYLRERRLAYIAVDEAKRATLGDEPVKSLDFIVHGPDGPRLLIDVKGRRYPGGTAANPRRVWENWYTQDDVTGLERWQARFGAGYLGLLVFVYRLAPTVRLPVNTPDVWAWRERRYLLRAVTVADYRRRMRVRSPKWGTVCLTCEAFREVVRPFSAFTRSETASAAGVQ
jgi:hypothetical protein